MHNMELDLSDKIRSFLIEKNKDLLFDELSERFLESGNLKDILTGIPVPITGDATDNFTNLTIAMGMARVIGADPDFRYAEAYRACLCRMYGENAEKVLDFRRERKPAAAAITRWPASISEPPFS